MENVEKLWKILENVCKIMKMYGKLWKMYINYEKLRKMYGKLLLRYIVQKYVFISCSNYGKCYEMYMM